MIVIRCNRAEACRCKPVNDMSRLTMYQYYFPPYQAAIDAGVGSVMSSFNVVDGVPASGNRWLLNDLLRQQWGFTGLVASDYTAINEMTLHGMGDEEHAAELALKAGVDMDMVGETYVRFLPKLLAATLLPLTVLAAGNDSVNVDLPLIAKLLVGSRKIGLLAPGAHPLQHRP